MLTIVVLLPALAGLVLAWRRVPERLVPGAFVAATAVELALLVGMWVNYAAGGGVTSPFAYEQQVAWLPSVGSSYHVGLDGLSLPLVTVTAVLNLACALFSLHSTDRPRTFAALLLVLETTSIGLFSALDLLVFFVFFDLSLVAMYFVIAGWGHGQAARSALRFFLYTFVGSLSLLVGFIGLYVASAPHTFDIVALARQAPLSASPAAAGLVLLAVSLGLAVKTPTVPFHTWLPPAHTDAPAAGSALLAGVLLKMGTYGFLRIVLPVLPGPLRSYALVFVVVGVVGIVYGALVALAQTDLKRLVAYTSVAHMGFVVLAVGAAGMVARTDGQARALALSGATVQMVSHALVTGALFLLTGVLWRRAQTYDLAAYGGVAGVAPRFALLFAVAAFASLGLPGLSGFIAEFEVLAGSLGAVPVAVLVALLGLLVTAALFLWSIQRVLLGPPGPATALVGDLTVAETAAVAPLLVLSVVIGLLPRVLLDVVEPATRTLAHLVTR